MNTKTRKKLVELGFTEDKLGHFTLSRCGYVFNVYVKSEKYHEIWMTVPNDDFYSVGWLSKDCPEAVAAGLEWFNIFVDLNVSRKEQS